MTRRGTKIPEGSVDADWPVDASEDDAADWIIGASRSVGNEGDSSKAAVKGKMVVAGGETMGESKDEVDDSFDEVDDSSDEVDDSSDELDNCPGESANSWV